MATTTLGKVSVTPKGAWSSSTAYEILDIVTNDGSSYIALKTVPAGTALSNTDYWQVIAEKGDMPTISQTTGTSTTEVMSQNAVTNALAGKVNTETGKGLSTNDYTTAEKEKLAGVEANANNYSLPVAGSALGGVKSGTDITVDSDGNVSVNDDSHNHIISNVDGLQDALDAKEATANKVTSMSASSTDTQYPSAKAVYDEVSSLNDNMTVIRNDVDALLGVNTDWSVVQRAVQSGRAATIYPVGHQFSVTHSVYGDIVFDVVGHNQVDSATGKTHTMTLLAHNCIANVQFDAEEAMYSAESTLAAGTYNFTVTSQPWYAGDVGKTFQFTTTVDLPAGGQLYVAMTYNATLVGKSVKLYASAESTTALETVTISEGSSGTSLGATDVALNHIQRMAFGSNNYKESAIRQFLNSNESAGAYWEGQTKYDRPPSWASSLAGFKAGLPSEFLAVVDTATVKCSTNSIYESPDSTTVKGTAYTLADEFWPASRYEIYGSSDVVDGSKLMTYFVGAGNDDRIKTLSGSARYWWLRTPHSGNACDTRYVYTDGSLHGYHANGAYGCVPACIIS